MLTKITTNTKNIIVKYCSRCKRTLPLVNFYKVSLWEKQRGLKPWCKECKKIYTKEYVQSGQSREQYLKRTHGITSDEYQKKLKSQNKRCAICGKLDTDNNWGVLTVDHNHRTNQIRGLLCNRCNTSLGNCEENIQILKNMLTYLEEYKNGKEKEKLDK